MGNRAEFLNHVAEAAGLASPEAAERLAGAVLTNLHDRLTPDEAAGLEAQLPADLKTLWHGSPVHALFHKAMGPMRLSYDAFFDKIAQQGGVPRERAEALTLMVFGLLKGYIGPCEAEDVASQLPRKLNVIWLDA
jgi:uncharacterized protein (DUF2267 family)